MNEQAALQTSTYSLPCTLSVSAFSTSGVKEINQDAYAYHLSSNELNQNSIFVVADGVSSSTVSQVASDFATRQFTTLFNIAPEQWTVKTRAETIIKEINALLYTRTQKSAFCYTPEKGYVCTLSVAIVTGNHLDVFHVGDSQIEVMTDDAKDPILLTRPHRQVSDSEPSQTYLANALGVKASIEIDHTSLTLTSPSTIAISTDGVYEFVALPSILNKINNAPTLSENQAALVVHEAFNNGSADNLTLLLIKVEFRHNGEQTVLSAVEDTDSNSYRVSNTVGHYNSKLPSKSIDELAFAELKIGDEIDGFKLERQLYTSARSHVFIAMQSPSPVASTNNTVVVKTPATDFSQSPEMLNGFLLENWFLRRVNSPHIVKSPTFTDLGCQNTPTAFYSVSSYVQGQTLTQWSIDNPTPSLEQIRNIIEQVGKGLQAMHRQGMLHRDIRPDNIIISEQGHCTLIDLGSAALKDAPSLYSDAPIPGAALFAAPEYFLGNVGTERSDLFSLALLTYYLLCGRYPYHSKLAHCHTFAEQKKLKYETALDPKRPIPTWVDSALKRALHINPDKRYSSLSEFIHSLRYPNPSEHTTYQPLVKRHPLFVYKALILALIVSNLITLILFN
ncbi:serine/threonine protein kinase [Alteromonas sp. BL110]|uniref:protein kinase domain-containing protein n=1 Tax=Alteromonas sp. BL110 TaxID=1714845 RepID=UPI000E49E99F|nr:protein phosphatase 2C domain-containing protein [Alteromonas sp. BL110]AXT37299.1 serine/threonine protein kinase [Alteromonas sp. BL110]RKM80037.1 serine/threonine protein kinase [Alteromonas sp. BL110]